MKINTLNRRRQLKPRKTPYFASIAKGKAIGFYRMADSGTWHARLRTPDGKHHHHPLGGDIESDYDEMVQRARDWFDEQASTETPQEPYTVRKCVTDYVEHLKVETGATAARDAKQRLEKHLLPKLGKVGLIELTTRDVKQWRDGLVRVTIPSPVGVADRATISGTGVLDADSNKVFNPTVTGAGSVLVQS